MNIKEYRTIILPVVLCGCETWSLTLREEYRMRVFENWVLKNVFGPNRDEVTGDWRKLHKEKRHYFYSSPNIIRVIRSRKMTWKGLMTCVGYKRGVYRGFGGEPRRKGNT
jgi:hypothetical protein